MTDQQAPTPMDGPEAGPTARRQLNTVRDDLLRVHRALLHVERARYEKVHGRIPSQRGVSAAGIGDPWFDWLRPMGQMVVLIDERMEDKKNLLASGEATALLARAREMLRADAEGDAFQRLYYQALQLSPDLAVLHGEVARAHRS